jgi:hypothetical protein
LPTIPAHETRLCYLLVYGLRVRNRGAKRRSAANRSRTVSGALQAVGKGFTILGEPDPRNVSAGSRRLHPLLKAFLDALAKEDDPASRSHPANTTILRQLPAVLDQADPGHQHTIDLCIVGFYWLLRPAEYLDSTGQTRSQAFRLGDISFALDGRELPAADASLNDLDLARLARATLTFNDQKNAVRGERITHASTGDPWLCPCKALARACARLRAGGAPADTPLHSYYAADGSLQSVMPRDVTAALRLAAQSLQTATGIDPALLSARSLRPGGATALLCSGIDTNVIQLLGRWRSDAMMRYLRVAALAHSDNLAQRMLDAGAYTFAPAAAAADMPVPDQAPREFIEALQRENLYHS